LAYYYDNDGVKRFDIYTDKNYIKMMNPLYYTDTWGRKVDWNAEMEKDPFYERMILTANGRTFFHYQRFSPYSLLNIRVSKEIRNSATISFYANNFLNLEGNSKNNVTGQKLGKNSPIYFGAEVKFRF
jgi:hypothetical protein